MVIIRILKSSSIDLGESNRSPYAKMKAWMIDGSRRRAVEIGFLALLAIMVWGLFSLPTVFYLRSKTSKVLLLRTTRTQHPYACVIFGTGKRFCIRMVDDVEIEWAVTRLVDVVY